MNQNIAAIGNLLFHVSPALYRPLYTIYKAISDKTERRLMRRVIRPGMTILDIGANIGTSTQFFLDLVGSEGVIYAFEPEDKNYSLLMQKLSNKPNVHLIKGAVSNLSGELPLYVSDKLNVDHHTYADNDARKTTIVTSYALDDFLCSNTIVNFIKIDVQGFEFHVLRGAKRILSENKDISLLLEFWPYGLKNAGSNPHELIDFLYNLGFKLNIIGLDVEFSHSQVGNGLNDYVNLFASRKSIIE
jgi:FkbM family methyltransferase